MARLRAPARLTGPLVLLLLGGGLSGAPRGAAAAGSPPPPFSPEELADRWLESTRKGDRSSVKGFFADGARAVFEAAGRSREVKPTQYADLLAVTVKGLKDFHRERGQVERFPGDGARIDSVLEFTVTDRIVTPQGFELESVQREVFEMAAGDPGRAVSYRSRTVSCEAIRKPEPWLNYGGPVGLNGHLIEAHYQAAPEGMGLVIAAAAVAIALLLKVLHSLGIKKRF